MKYLLLYIREWAEKFPTYNSVWSLDSNHGASSEREAFASTSETEWFSVYNALLKEHVTFPSREQRIPQKAATARVHTANNNLAEGIKTEEAKITSNRIINASEARDLI